MEKDQEVCDHRPSAWKTPLHHNTCIHLKVFCPSCFYNHICFMFALSLCCCLSAAPSHCMSTTINHTMCTIGGIAVSYGCERKAQSLGDSTPMKMSKDFKWVFDSDFMTVYICSFMPLYREWREHVYVVLRSFVGSLVSDSEHNKLTCCSWIQSGNQPLLLRLGQ